MDTGRCVVRDLENLDAVVREAEAVMQSLLTSRIIEDSDRAKNNRKRTKSAENT